jgi:hypothetical protein
MRKLSLAVRLTMWYVLVLALAEIVFGASMWLLLRHNLYDLVDDGLERQIDDLKTFLRAQPADMPVAQLQGEVGRRLSEQHAGDYLELRLESGDLIYRSAFLQSHSSALLLPDQIQHPIYRSRKIADQHFRFAFEKLATGGHVYAIEMGVPADGAASTLRLYRFDLFTFSPLLLVLAGGIGYVKARNALSTTGDPAAPA